MSSPFRAQSLSERLPGGGGESRCSCRCASLHINARYCRCFTQPLQGWAALCCGPRVAWGTQPGAGLRNTVGVGEEGRGSWEVGKLGRGAGERSRGEEGSRLRRWGSVDRLRRGVRWTIGEGRELGSEQFLVGDALKLGLQSSRSAGPAVQGRERGTCGGGIGGTITATITGDDWGREGRGGN